MQVSTGNITTLQDICRDREIDFDRLMEMKRDELFETLRDNGGYVPLDDEDVPKVKRMAKPRRKNWMRNKPCICGSKKKFKRCCWNKYA